MSLAPFVSDTNLDPASDQFYQTFILYTVPEHLDEPFVFHGIEELSNVQIQHPVHFPLDDAKSERIECIVLASTRPESVGKAFEVSLVDLIEPVTWGSGQQVGNRSKET